MIMFGERMKLIVFGATGGTGQQIISQALTQDHSVTAFVHNSANVLPIHDDLTTVQGDVLDQGAVEKAVRKHDVVVCTLGHPPTSSEQLRAKGTKNIIYAMERSGIKRLICQSALGVGDSRYLLPLHYKMFILPFILRRVYADHEMQESYIKASRLDWIIVRSGILIDSNETKNAVQVCLEKNKKISLKISREDVADFMLKQLADDRYLHKTPCISY
jgi:putative NADH-flavin reductase